MIKKIFTSLLICALLCSVAFTVVAEDPTTTTTEQTQTTTTTEDVAVGATTTADTETTTTADTETTTTVGAIQGEQNTRLIIMNLNDKLTARVTDSKGNPLAGVKVYLQLGTTEMPGVETDQNGYANFRYAYPQDGVYIYCYTEDTVIENVTYRGAKASVGTAQTTVGATTLQGEETTTSKTTYRQTSKHTTRSKTTRATTKTLVKYTGVGTTGMEETYISLSAGFDSGILEAFGHDEQRFAEDARLLLAPESYAAILGDLNGVLTLNVATSNAEVTDEQITAALQNDVVLSQTPIADISRIVLDLSLQCFLPQEQQTVDMWNVTNGSYIVQLPIPKSMRGAQSITVSSVNKDGISEPIVANVSKDGFFRFETTSPVQTVLIMGFPGSFLGSLANGSVRIAIVFLVLGLLCIGGAVFLFFYFVYTPKKGKKNEIPAAEAQDIADDVQIADGPQDDENVALDMSLDIFSADGEEKPKDPKDYDIEL